MLAKLGWRHIKNVDALVSRILKAKYYANSEFMNAQLGSNPSYTWIREVYWKVQQCWKKGLMWRVESGQWD